MNIFVRLRCQNIDFKYFAALVRKKKNRQMEKELQVVISPVNNNS